PEVSGSQIEPKDLFFQCGQAFSSLNTFKYIADQYSGSNGFKVIYYKGGNRSNDPNKKARNVESKKCSCPWSIRLNHNQDDDKYYISQAILHHNYSLIPVQLMRILPSNREIPEDIREEILLSKKVGISVLQIQSLLVMKYGPATKKWMIRDIYNLISSDCMLRNEFQAHDFLLLLQQKHRDNPEFSFEFELNCDNRLKHCNYFSMPFGVFTGVTNNGLSYCVAGALLRDETPFIRIFGTVPRTILTDNDLSMSDAIRSILMNKHSTKHGLCIWHMLKNIRSNMTSKLGSKYSEFHTDLVKYLNHCIDQNYFFADISSTQRGESMNKLLKGFLDRKSMLSDFLAAFERAFDTREEAKHVSKKFAAKWSAKDAYRYEEITKDDDLCHFKLSRYEKPDNIRWLDSVYFPKRWQKDLSELELAKDYINFYSNAQSQTPETPTLHESSSESTSQLRYMRIHRLSEEIVNKIATDPNKCADFMSYLEKYLKELYTTSSNVLGPNCMSHSSENILSFSKHPIVSNPIKSKAVGRPKKGRIETRKRDWKPNQEFEIFMKTP
ncbi:2286_t:CDS:2, partial [Scutellospora calospora]